MSGSSPIQTLAPDVVDDTRLLVGGVQRLGFTPTRQQREEAVERLRQLVFVEGE